MKYERSILLDVSRSVWRAASGRRPTGIDRVCLAYIKHYRARAQAVVQFGRFRRILSAEASSTLFDLLLDDKPNFETRLLWRMARHLPAIGQGQTGKNRPYLNVGHTGLDNPELRRWIDNAAVRPIYMVHDLIPITHPEYARPGEAQRHEKRMATVLETAAGIIFNSNATRDSMAAWASKHQIPLPDTQVIWLGTKHLKAASTKLHVGQPFFITLGTIEGRKNHLLLLNLWRDWAERSQTPIPKLVIVGQRGWAAEQTLAMLDRCPSLTPHVVEYSNCDDELLADLVASARALLFPSFVEGYGMPLVEALMAGAPVIASNLPVFREIAGSIPIFCDPLNARAWEEAIMNFIPAESELRLSQCAALQQYGAPTWTGHFERLDRWLAELGAIQPLQSHVE